MMYNQTINQGSDNDLTVSLDESGLTLEDSFGMITFQIGDLPTVFETIEEFQVADFDVDSFSKTLSLSSGEFMFDRRGTSAFVIQNNSSFECVLIDRQKLDWVGDIRNLL
ncbi:MULTISPECIES: hypothetical protein [unclassified Leptolyngbya]|uniref:hypothetical protein n=1 Tax=unclassified Leptolyngbya TaxID=2650499 RepID=UPI003D3169E5